MWKILSEAELEVEVRELCAEARTWYKRKGGVIPAQAEQMLKVARFLAGLRGFAARREVSDMMSFVMEQVPGLALQEDKWVAVMEAAQVRRRLGVVAVAVVVMMIVVVVVVGLVWGGGGGMPGQVLQGMERPETQQYTR